MELNEPRNRQAQARSTVKRINLEEPVLYPPQMFVRYANTVILHGYDNKLVFQSEGKVDHAVLMREFNRIVHNIQNTCFKRLASP